MLIAAACIAAGILVWALGGGGHGLGALFFGLVLLLGILFERWRYRSAPRSGASWQKTGERFSDPQTGRVVEVFYDPQSGERRYLEADGTPYPPPDP
jgi:hypothetical protein